MKAKLSDYKNLSARDRPAFGWKLPTITILCFLAGISLGYIYTNIWTPKKIQWQKEKAEKLSIRLVEENKKDKPIFNEYKIPILLYHYIEYPSNPDDFIRRGLTVLPSNFDNQIKRLLDAEYQIITPYDLYLGIINKKMLYEKSAIITFDDGFRDFYTDAYPIVKKYQIPVTMFITTGLIGQPNYLTHEQVKELVQSNLVEFGSHSWSHKNVALIPKKYQEEEIYYGKKYFEDIYGVELRYFAYPYGTYHNVSEEMVKDAGFILAMSVVGDGTKVSSIDTLYHLPRIKMGNISGQYLVNFLENYFEGIQL